MVDKRTDIRMCNTKGCDKQGVWTNAVVCPACGKRTAKASMEES